MIVYGRMVHVVLPMVDLHPPNQAQLQHHHLHVNLHNNHPRVSTSHAWRLKTLDFVSLRFDIVKTSTMIECTCEECDKCILHLMKCLGDDRLRMRLRRLLTFLLLVSGPLTRSLPGRAAAAPTVAPAVASGRGANTPSQSTPPCTQQAQPPPASGE
jgi:hypothetical protein